MGVCCSVRNGYNRTGFQTNVFQKPEKKLFHEIIMEAFEDITSSLFYREGEATEKTSKKDIFKVREGHP